MKRYAIIYTDKADTVARYLPGNYSVVFTRPLSKAAAEQTRAGRPGQDVTVIEGEDSAGWTMDDYVLPRLASGLYIGQEIDLSHPIMKSNPDSPDGMIRA